MAPSATQPPPPVSQASPPSPVLLLQLPIELQVNLLTYLRAFDLIAVQQTCRYYNQADLIHKIVVHAAERVYPVSLTRGFEQQPVLYRRTDTFSLEDLRNMELLIVARVLSQPEPTAGYVVSKSWCKTALRWLELHSEQQTQRCLQLAAQKRQHHKKAMSKKKQRAKDRRLSDATPPWPNVNADIVCEHNSLQMCSNSKTARARRRLMDKQAWKTLRKLFPDSVTLESADGECLQCMAEQQIQRKNQQDHLEALRLQRKLPLADPHIRTFYLRTKGVPEDALLHDSRNKLPPGSTKCPLLPGTYYVIPRAWSVGWRRYIKTGEGGTPVRNGNGATTYPAPDAACLLCHAHRLLLLPPHLEAFLYGECTELLGVLCGSSSSSSLPPPPAISTLPSTVSATVAASSPSPPTLASPPTPRRLDTDSADALMAAGFSTEQVRQQISAMQLIEQQQQQAAIAAATTSNNTGMSLSKNERLDRENYSTVEIVTEAEFMALEKQWPHLFGVKFQVGKIPPKNHRNTIVENDDDDNNTTLMNNHLPSFGMPVCRDCDATGLIHRSKCVVRGRVKNAKTGDTYKAIWAPVEY